MHMLYCSKQGQAGRIREQHRKWEHHVGSRRDGNEGAGRADYHQGHRHRSVPQMRRQRRARISDKQSPRPPAADVYGRGFLRLNVIKLLRFIKSRRQRRLED